MASMFTTSAMAAGTDVLKAEKFMPSANAKKHVWFPTTNAALRNHCSGLSNARNRLKLRLYARLGTKVLVFILEAYKHHYVSVGPSMVHNSYDGCGNGGS